MGWLAIYAILVVPYFMWFGALDRYTAMVFFYHNL